MKVPKKYTICITPFVNTVPGEVNVFNNFSNQRSLCATLYQHMDEFSLRFIFFRKKLIST